MKSIFRKPLTDITITFNNLSFKRIINLFSETMKIESKLLILKQQRRTKKHLCMELLFTLAVGRELDNDLSLFYRRIYCTY